MTRYAIPTYAQFPYYTNATANDEKKRHIQKIVLAIKNAGRQLKLVDGPWQPATKLFVDLIVPQRDRPREPFLNSHVALVPLPSSTGLGMRPPHEWPCLELAQHLQAAGLGTAVPAVIRKTAIPTSHLVPANQKPTVAMVADSVSVDLPTLHRFRAVTLIDDVVSSGTNAIGVWVALQRAGFTQVVRLFATARTMSDEDDESQPFVGECVWFDNKPDKPRAFRPRPR